MIYGTTYRRKSVSTEHMWCQQNVTDEQTDGWTDRQRKTEFSMQSDPYVKFSFPGATKMIHKFLIYLRIGANNI